VSFTFRCALIFVDTYAHTLLLEVISIFQVPNPKASGLIACTFYIIFMCLLCNLGTSLLCPLFLLRELSRYLLGKTEKASLSSYKCDLSFAYDVISILHVLFVFNNNKKRVFWGEFAGLFLLGLLDIVCIFT
jgi:hypothetical protein